MKPKLDRLVDMIVESLSGEAQDFYNREFAFFDEVTSISGKLKPFIKSPKPEKKVRTARFFPSLYSTDTLCRPKSMRKWPRSRSTSVCIFRVIRTASWSTSTARPAGRSRVTPRYGSSRHSRQASANATCTTRPPLWRPSRFGGRATRPTQTTWRRRMS